MWGIGDGINGDEAASGMLKKRLGSGNVGVGFGLCVDGRAKCG